MRMAALLPLTLLWGCTPQEDKPRALCPDMAVIEPGEFVMGVDEPGGPDDEFDGPARRVHITQPFAVSRYEVTVGEFRRFAEETGHPANGGCQVYEADAWWFPDPSRSWRDPGFAQSDDHPVVCVSWHDTKAYIDWLNGRSGLNFRLLSEAEWEYLAATGAPPGRADDAAVSHDSANIGQETCCGPATQGRDRWLRTAPVGSFPADRHGLHDIRGNVWEWQEDCFHINYIGAPADSRPHLTSCSDASRRMVRGGSWGDGGELLAATYRLRAAADNAYFTLGFRLARTLP